MSKYLITSLGDQAKDYFKERLDEKESLTLSKYSRDNIDLKKGEILTLSPNYLSPEKLNHFNWSILVHQPNWSAKNRDLPYKKADFSAWLTKEIREFLSINGNNYCIMEAASDYPQKGIITRFPFKNVLYKGEPYYILDQKDSIETIKESIKYNTSYHPLGIGIFTSIVDLDKYINSQNIITSEEFFKVALENTKKIYIDAYDWESYLIWEK